MRKLPALVVAAALITTLSACTSANSSSNASATGASGHCEVPFTSGKASELVSATGAFGQEPEVSFPRPLITVGNERTTLVGSDASPIHAGQVVDLQLSLYLGSTGTKLTQSSYEPDRPIRRTAGDPEDFFGTIVECAAVGQRLAATTTVEAVYGRDALLSLGMGNEDTLVAVIDVQRAYLARANGADLPAQRGMPAVVTAPDGTPGITIPSTDAPTTLRVATTKAGTGQVVEPGANLVTHILAVDWQTKRVVQSTWSDRSAAVAQVTDIAEHDEGLPSGLVEALQGQRVGSQVLVVLPPEAGFPADQLPSGVSEGDTLIYVVDILGIEHE